MSRSTAPPGLPLIGTVNRLLQMAGSVTLADVLRLSVAERILLVEDIWDSILEHPDAVELTDTQKRELETRIKSHRKNPAAAADWTEVKARVRRKAGDDAS